MQTVEEIDRALLEIPASPTTNEDLEARARLMARRFELISAQQKAADAPKPRVGITVVAPEHVSNFQGQDGLMRNVEVVDGRRVLQLGNWSDFIACLRGPHGLAWRELNVEAIQKLAAANIRI